MSRRILLSVLLLAVGGAVRQAAAQENPTERLKPAIPTFQASPQTPAPTSNVAPQVDPAKLVATAAANVRRNGVLAKNYAFERLVNQTFYDKQGKVQEHNVAKYNVIGIFDQVRQFERDGKTLAGMVPGEEHARLVDRGWYDWRLRLFYGLRYENDNPRGGFRRDIDLTLPLEDLPRFFNVRILGVQRVHDRPAYVIEATPRRDAKPRKDDNWELCWQAKAWIDVEDAFPARSHYDVIADCYHLGKGSSVDVEWQKINNEVWLPSREFLTWKWKLSRFSLTQDEVGQNVLVQAESIYSRFQKSKVETHSPHELAQPAPGSLAHPQPPPATPDRMAKDALPSSAPVVAGRQAAGQESPTERLKPAIPVPQASPQTPAPTSNVAPQVDPAKLVAAAAANWKGFDLVKNYAYEKFVDETWYDKHGNVESHSTLKYDIAGEDQEDNAIPIEVDGKPLSAEEQEKRKRALARGKAVPIPPEHPLCYRRGWRFSFPFEDFPTFFNIRMLGLENVSGRPAYVIEATPRKDAKPPNRWELCFQAKAWIDVKDTFPVRLHYDAITDCECIIKGSSFEAELQKINDEVWLPKTFLSRVNWKFFLFFKTLVQFNAVYSNFRKFRVDTRVADVSKQPAMESSPRPKAPLAMSNPTADELAIRALVQKIIAAYQQRDSPALFSLFNGNSPNLLILKMKLESSWALHETVERKNLNVREIDIRGDQASVRVSYQLSGANATGSGEPSTGENFFTLELVRDGDAWKMWNFLSDAADLAERLATAESDEERDSLLASEKPLVSEELVEILVGQGHEFMAMGQFEVARNNFNIARRVADRLHDQKALGWALYGLGHGSLAQGNAAAAAGYFQQGLAICEALGDKTLLAAATSFIGQHYAELGNYRQAMEYYQKSIAASGDASKKELLALTLESVGDMFVQQGNDDQALDYYERSLKLFVFGKTLNSIGEVLTRKGDYSRALQYYQKSLQLFQDSDFFSVIAAGLRSIGDNYFLQGRSDEALDYYQKSLERYDRLGHKTGIAKTFGRIANLYYKKGEYDRAIEFGTRAQAIARELENPSDLSSILTTLGKTYLAASKYEQAKQVLMEAISTVEKQRTQVVGSEHDQEMFFERNVDPYHAMVELLVKQHSLAEAFEYAERAKGRVLLNVLRNGRENIAKTMSTEERAQEQGLNQVLVTLNSELQRENLQRRPDQALIAAINAQLKKARLQYEAFETELYGAHPDLRIQRGETGPLPMEQTQTLVSNGDTSFLEYVVEQERTYLFALTRDAEGKVALKVHIIEISAEDLAKRSADFRTKLATNSLDFREPARRLYDLLLAPAEQQLTGKKTVCLVPAGPLWELPFQALVSKRNRYLLEEHALFYVPSLSVLYEMRSRLPEAYSALSQTDGPADVDRINAASMPAISSQVLFAVANPTLNHGESSRAGTAGGDLPYAPLPEQEELVKTLGQIYGSKNSTVLIGQAATEEAVKTQAGKYAILHFSTHGTLDNDNPLYSRLLLRSASPEEDGLLEAREIMELNLHADMAVLSACETARGRVRAGEGLIGMSWALFVAGTPTTVASQWQVDSASTARLMAAFHRKLKSQLLPSGLQLNTGQVLRHPFLFHRLLKSQSSLNSESLISAWEISKAEILRQAALKLMLEPKYRHPFYWAGFVMMGDGQ